MIRTDRAEPRRWNDVIGAYLRVVERQTTVEIGSPVKNLFTPARTAGSPAASAGNFDPKVADVTNAVPPTRRPDVPTESTRSGRGSTVVEVGSDSNTLAKV
jgi:hypothetical protein